MPKLKYKKQIQSLFLEQPRSEWNQHFINEKAKRLSQIRIHNIQLQYILRSFFLTQYLADPVY